VLRVEHLVAASEPLGMFDPSSAGLQATLSLQSTTGFGEESVDRRR
jgi:hypothetical protein